MNNHDFSDPIHELNMLEAVWHASDSLIPRCPHCHDKREVVPMAGNGWGVETFHEPTCPDHEDNQPALEADFDEQ